MKLGDVLDEIRRRAIVARFGATDPRAVISMWASAYFTDTLPPLLAANVLFDLAPRLDAGRVSFNMAPTLRIRSLKIGPKLVSFADCSIGTRFAGLLSAHLAPLVELVSDRGGVTSRVLWSNIGNVFEAFMRKLDGPAGGRPGLEQAGLLLASPILSGGNAIRCSRRCAT